MTDGMIRAIRIFAILLLCFLTVKSIPAAAGDLDTNFGSGGKMITLFPPYRNYARRVRIQSDGKIVTLVHSWGLGTFPLGLHGSFITRHNADGTPDATFGANGVVNTNLRVLYDFVILPNGKIMAVGYYGNGFLLYRYNSDGTTDSNFGVNGVVTTQVGGRASGTMGIVLQPDGKIVVFGYTVGENSSIGNVNIARYYQDGSLDAGFGSNGVFFTSISIIPYFEIIQDESIVVYFREALIQPDGKLLFGLTSPNYRLSLVRINPNGTFDNTFGTNGVSSDFLPFYEDSISGIALEPDGKIVVNAVPSFEGISTTVVSRFNSNGTPDTSFGSGGHIVSTEQNVKSMGLGATVAVQRDGRILTAGTRDGTFALSRYNLDGTIDNSFGTNGILKTPVGNNPGLDTIFAMAFQPDGKLVAAGSVRNSSGSYDLGLVRYLFEPPSVTPFDFDGDGRADLSVFRPTDQTWYLRTNQGGLNAVPFGSGTDKLVPADYDGDGKTDIAVFRNGTWAVRRSSDGANALTAFGQAGDIPVAGDYDGDHKADIAVFRPSNSVWYILKSSDNTVDVRVFGDGADRPVQGDYDGDGKTDVAVFRASTGVWYVLNSRNNTVSTTTFGNSTDNLVPADYDGDGRMDIAIFRNGVWAVRRSSDNTDFFAAFGQSGDVPVPADYDGDGKADEAILRDGTWNILQSSGGITIQLFGLPGDNSIP